MSDWDFEPTLRARDPDTWQTIEDMRRANAAAAQKETQRAMRRARCASLLEAVEAQNNNTLGTPPEDIFGQRGANLCRGFLKFMGVLGNPKITELEGTLRLPGRQIGSWRTQGYYLGEIALPKGSRDDFSDPAQVPLRAFLCTDGDGRLRAVGGRQGTLLGNIPLFVDRDDQTQRMTVELRTYEEQRTWVPGGWEYDVDGGRNHRGSSTPGHWDSKMVQVPGTLEQVLADRVKYALPKGP